MDGIKTSIGGIMSYETLHNMIKNKRCPKTMIDEHIELMYLTNLIDEKSVEFLKMIAEYSDRFGYYDF